MAAAASQAVLMAGLDPERLPWELSRLGPSFDILEGRAAAHALLDRVRADAGRLVVLGQWLPDLTLDETIRRIRTDAAMKRASVIAITAHGESPVPGANVVLPLSADGGTVEQWVSKLRAVPQRVRISAQVRGRTVPNKQPFFGFVRNISTAGMRVFSPDELPEDAELDLWLELSSSGEPAPALARIVRAEAGIAPLKHAYGIEFVYLPQATEDAVTRLISGGRPNRPTLDTLRTAAWTYEVIGPVRHGERWEVEVWRAGPMERGERFLTLAGATAREALREAREVLLSYALVRTGACVMSSEAPVPLLRAGVRNS